MLMGIAMIDKADLLTKSSQMLMRHEGERLKVYRCPSGKLTIGYGRNLEDKGIRKSEAKLLLYNDILEAITLLEGYFPEWCNFSMNRQVALIDMVYNLGWNGFLKFKTLIGKILLNQWELAAEAGLQSLWAKQVGDRATEVTNLLKEG